MSFFSQLSSTLKGGGIRVLMFKAAKQEKFQKLVLATGIISCDLTLLADHNFNTSTSLFLSQLEAPGPLALFAMAHNDK